MPREQKLNFVPLVYDNRNVNLKMYKILNTTINQGIYLIKTSALKNVGESVAVENFGENNFGGGTIAAEYNSSKSAHHGRRPTN